MRRLVVGLAICAGLAGCDGQVERTETTGRKSAPGISSAVAATPRGPACDVHVDPPVPAAPAPRGWLQLEPIGGFLHGQGFATSAAEIVAHDAGSQRLFVVNGESRAIDILDIADPTDPRLVTSVDVSEHGNPNSVASRNGMIATCIASTSRNETGVVVFLSVDGDRLATLDVGYEPDMLTFTPDGRWLLVANEGEPLADYAFDAEGTISQIDLSEGIENLTQAQVTTLDFRRFNDQRESLDPSIRIFGKGATVAQDLEPEYITVSADSKTAWIVCQENNAIAIADLEAKEITRLIGLGFKDHSQDGNWLDASDKDGKIRIRPWPIKGMFLPDAVASFNIGGQTYLVTANEGDARNHAGFSEEVRVADLQLDPAAFPNAKELQKKEHLGRLRVTTANGDADGDGLYEEIYSFGTRSFSIWTAEVEQVFDSGDQFERIVAEQHPQLFNSDHESHSFDDRSDNKGPEPEGVVIGLIDDVPYAFILLERMSGVMVYDVSDPAAPVFERFVSTRDPSQDPGVGTGGDLGPEGGVFIPAEKSPTGEPLLVVAYEVSGTTRIYRVAVSRPKSSEG